MMTKKQKQAKVSRVMREFKAGTLKSSSGEPVKNYKQAVAIALSEAGMSMKKDASEEYMKAFIRQVLAEEEETEEEGEEEMDESTGEKRCKAYLSAVRANKGKKT
jgi:hypothetical protein